VSVLYYQYISRKIRRNPYIHIISTEAAMAITKSSLLPTSLKGAQDENIGDQDEAKKAGQAMRVHLVQELTREMEEHIKSGKAQAVLGPNPVCLQCSRHNTMVALMSWSASEVRQQYIYCH
jgi:hypothetical protein